MSSTFISPVITRASQLGVSLYEDSNPIELLPNSSTQVLRYVGRWLDMTSKNKLHSLREATEIKSKHHFVIFA